MAYNIYAKFLEVIILICLELFSVNCEVVLPELFQLERSIIGTLRNNRIRCTNIREMELCKIPVSLGYAYTDGCSVCSCLHDDPRLADVSKWLKLVGKQLDLDPASLVNQPAPIATAATFMTQKNMNAMLGYKKNISNIIYGTIETCVKQVMNCVPPRNMNEKIHCFTLSMIQQQHLYTYVEELRGEHERNLRGLIRNFDLKYMNEEG